MKISIQKKIKEGNTQEGEEKLFLGNRTEKDVFFLHCSAFSKVDVTSIYNCVNRKEN